MHQRARGVAVVCILCAWSSLYADVTLPAVIGDRMVLQRDMHVPIWGRAEPGEDVTVAAGAASAAAKAGADGRWMVRLAPMPAGGPIDITVKGKNEIVLRDVLVGDVWVCSGQSNMQWTVGASANAAEEVAKAVHAGIRLFSVPRVVALEPLADVKAAWAV
ncbi:MAG TPA: sialate O-acetylesterase, partial [Planctomycetes bacterium]|nr:sialate O-acetylesterase [Planctomycetota bacterium]